MDKPQTARWNRQLKIKQVRQDFAATPVAALVARKFTRHDELLKAADDLMSAPTSKSRGATLKKSEEENKVMAQAMPFANALHLLYLEAGEDEKAHALLRNKSDYTALPGALVLAEGRKVSKQAHALAQTLAADADLNTADLKALDGAIDAFGKVIAAPKVAIEAGKNTNTALDAALSAADLFVKMELTPALETLKGKNRKFYDALKQAIRIDDAPGAHGPATPPAKPAA